MTEQNYFTITKEERSKILQAKISEYVRDGYRVVSQTDFTAQLIKPKRFSLFWAIFWFLFFGVGVFIYLFYYWSKKDQTSYLTVDEYGITIGANSNPTADKKTSSSTWIIYVLLAFLFIMAICYFIGSSNLPSP